MQYAGISYRDEGNGKGAFFDHLTVRKMTGWLSTCITAPEADTLTFANYINHRAVNSQYGLPLDDNLPPQANNEDELAAFIFIPGYTRDSDNNQPSAHIQRLAHEEKLIQKAMYRGQPILAVCAGSWTLWQAYGGNLQDVKDHNYGGGMPRLSQAKAEICNNKMLHRVRAEEGTLLAQSLTTTFDFPVNSVHWRAVDPRSNLISKNIRINAYSVQDTELAPNSRQGTKMQPDRSVEGFETIHGVPMIGVQWHPEAFNPHNSDAKPHTALFKTIQDAGITYLNRRKVNSEFKAQWHEHNGIGFFKSKNPIEPPEHIPIRGLRPAQAS